MVVRGKRCDAGDGAVRRRALSAVVAGLLLSAVCGCGADVEPGGGSPERAAVQDVLDRQASAVRSGAERGFLAAVDPREERFRTAQRRVFGNLRRLPLTQWTYRVVDVKPLAADEPGESSAGPSGDGGGEAAGEDRKSSGPDGGGSRFEAEVRLRYKLRGDDLSPVSATERFTFVERAGKWYMTGELPGSERQLWEQGEIGVVRGKQSLVLGADRSRGALKALARSADRAVAQVDREWPQSWPHRVVVESPSSVRDMARILDAPSASYEGIAAVTTGEAGENTDAPADRIVVNPEAYGALSGEGQQVVVTHETVHVASRTHTSRATPLWLSEGFADWVAYGATDRKPTEAAAELVRAAGERKLPRQLPTDRDFRFGSEPESLGRAYESGWLACRLIAEEWGKERLKNLYLRIGSSQKRQSAAVDEAMRGELGLGTEEFTERWRSYVRQELS
ncbi:hypothetical protein K378_03056 [Streptomyces sp. Amel2xB2]|uniref:hypothetical protein n=1 Tax=Streptomyces sp. Amel2xB2 TaxID=1305829 RepID=UPI000DC04CE8|nr:hypothetical protein [Streptomyces sp. Amel2xB2]RAJ65441.1 hypothetical protein K378_03056 [Streptomyces sp. Amel2xB2]